MQNFYAIYEHPIKVRMKVKMWRKQSGRPRHILPLQGIQQGRNRIQQGMNPTCYELLITPTKKDKSKF